MSNKQLQTKQSIPQLDTSKVQLPSINKAALMVVAALILPSSFACAQDTVTYQFDYVAEWSEATHPLDFPSNAHITPAVGASHTEDISLWTPGGIATDGLEQLAERGTRAVLEVEIEHLIATTDFVNEFHRQSGVGASPGSRTSFITLDADFSVVTLVAMLAPSPDWFVGIHDVNLRENGLWIRELVIDLEPYDSGTDSGTNYTSPNADITPHIPIANLSDVFPFIGTPRIGTFTFTLTTSAACSRADFAEPYEQFDFFDVSAFLSAFAAQNPSADINNDGEYNFFDVSDFLTLFSAGCP